MVDKTLTLVTVCFNSADTIKDTLDSVACQRVPPDEYIVIDGGSTDATLDIVALYDNVVTKVISERDHGIYDAMNKGLRLATCEFFGILNSDDVLHDVNVISDLKDSMNVATSIIYGNICYRSRTSSRVVRDWRAGNGGVNDFGVGWHPPHTGFFAKTNLLSEAGGFDLSMSVAADFDLMLKAFKINQGDVVWLDRYICLMLEGGESGKSVRNILIGNSEVRDSLRRHGFNVGLTYTLKRLVSKALARIKGG